MSDILTGVELDGLRQDFDEMLGDMLGTAKTTIAITRTTGATLGAINTTTLQYDAASPSVIYTGEAYISPVVYRRDRQEFVGGNILTIRQYRVLLPWDSGDIKLDDVVTIVSCSDPNFVNKTLTVIDVMYESELGARRITVLDDSTTGEDCP